jgi:SAM-dependent methyltransferase
VSDCKEIRCGVAAAYDKGHLAYGVAWTRSHPWLDEERHQFTARLFPGSAVLDIGSGPGHDSNFFASMDFVIMGIDISSSTVADARARYPHLEFIKMDVFDLDELPRQFDGIWMSYAFLHVPRSMARDALKKIKGHLKPNGIFFIVTSTDSETVEEVTTVEGLGDDIPVYTVRWNEEDLTVLLNEFFQEVWRNSASATINRRTTYSAIWKNG